MDHLEYWFGRRRFGWRDVFFLSDGPITGVDALTPADGTIAINGPLCVVEQMKSIATLPIQRRVRNEGHPVVVCSFFRSTRDSIGPCRDYFGSVSSVSAAAGMTVHCEQDLLRAARDLRGRLAAHSVSIPVGGHVMTVRADDVSRDESTGKSLVELIERLLCDAHAASDVA